MASYNVQGDVLLVDDPPKIAGRYTWKPKKKGIRLKHIICSYRCRILA